MAEGLEPLQSLEGPGVKLAHTHARGEVSTRACVYSRVKLDSWSRTDHRAARAAGNVSLSVCVDQTRAARVRSTPSLGSRSSGSAHRARLID